MKRSDTQTIIDALRVLELISDDGLAQMLILEAAERMDELQRQRKAADDLTEAASKILATINTHDTESLSCDRDGEAYCDCLSHAAVALRTAASAYTATKGGE